jgi:hypothetical protein
MAPRRLAAIGVFAGVLSLSVTGGLGWAGWVAFRDSKGRGGTVEAGPVKDQFPDTPSLLLVQTGDDAQKSLTGVTLLVKTPDKGGWVLDLPVDLQVSSGEDSRLSDSYKSGGKVGLQDAVEGLMRVTINDDEVAVVDQATLAGVFAPYSPTVVRFTKSVPDPLRANQTFVPSGSNSLDAGTLARLLTFRPPLETAADTQDRRLEIFRAVLGDPDLGAAPSATGSTTSTSVPAGTDVTSPVTAVPTPDGQLAADFVAWIRAGKNTYQSVAWTSPAAKDGSLKVNDAQLRLTVAEAMPARVNDLGTGPRLRVISRLGDQDNYLLNATLSVTGLANGVLVSATEADGPAPATTEYLYADDDDQATAEFMKQFLGPGDVKKDPRPIDGIAVVVNLGQNYADSLKQQEAQTTTTTSTTSPTTQSSTSVKKTTTTRKRTSTATTRRRK